MKTVLLFVALSLFTAAATACDFGAVKFDAEFSGGRLDGCEKNSNSNYALNFKPENRPINNSGWYAFKVTSNTRKILNLTLSFDGNTPRYLPKISHDGKHWQNIPFTADQQHFAIQIETHSQPLWVAGQEIVDNAYYKRWMDQLAGKGVQLVNLGNSTEGRTIQALVSKAKGKKANEWVVLLGRQHPPEVTGALAMTAFVDNTLGNNKLAKDFRKRFNLLIVPNMNPDGVEHGYWRHNVNGVDLNRDWNTFKQAETRLVRDFLQKLAAKGHKLVFAMDFHSTQEDVFYTIPSSAGVAPAMLVKQWLKSIKQQSKTFFKVRNKPGNSPGKGVFKQFVADTYKVHGVTYEIGDNSDRNLIKHIALLSSNELMQILLDTPARDFYVNDGQ